MSGQERGGRLRTLALLLALYIASVILLGLTIGATVVGAAWLFGWI